MEKKLNKDFASFRDPAGYIYYENDSVFRKINPCYTSQVCSCCGHWEEGQRVDQSHFKCKSCGTELNADFNASRNIAKSTLWCDEKITEKHKEEARKYYGITRKDMVA